MVCSCLSDALSLAPDLKFSLERDRLLGVPFDSIGRDGVEPFGVKPLAGRAGATPSSRSSCCRSSLTEKVSEWKDNRSLFDPGTKSLSRGITLPNGANWKSLQQDILQHHGYYFESRQHVWFKTFLLATGKQLWGDHNPLNCSRRFWIPHPPKSHPPRLPGHNPTSPF